MHVRFGFTLWCGVAFLLPPASTFAGQADSRDRGKATNHRSPSESRSTVYSKAPTAPQRMLSPRATMPQKSASSSRNAVASPPTRFQPSRPPAVAASSGRSSSPVSQSSSNARPPRIVSAPSVSRAPLIRAPQPAASDMLRTKAPPNLFVSQPRDSRPPSSSSRPIDRHSSDLSIHRGDDRDRGLIHIGADRDREHVGAGLYNHANRINDRRFLPLYGYGHYYRNYRPICYPGSRYYTPFYGYSYASVYLAEPYVVQVYDSSPTYVASSYAQEPIPTTVVQEPPQVASSPPTTGEPYRPLSAPQTPTSVDEGNAAFAAGRYEDASRLYVRAVMTDERDGYAKTLYAWANFALGDYEAASAAIRRALLTTPDLVDYPLDLRTLYPDRAVLDRHSDALMRFLADHPQHREAQLLWGYLLYSIGQAEPAASVFTALAGADQNDTLLSLLRDAAVRNARGSSPPPAAP